jgi:hypothetical protein
MLIYPVIAVSTLLVYAGSSYLVRRYARRSLVFDLSARRAARENRYRLNPLRLPTYRPRKDELVVHADSATHGNRPAITDQPTLDVEAPFGER